MPGMDFAMSQPLLGGGRARCAMEFQGTRKKVWGRNSVEHPLCGLHLYDN